MMTRAEKRRLMKDESKRTKTPTYQYTKEQIDSIIQTEVEKRIKDCKREITDEAINEAMLLLFTLPMKVLMDNFWQKSCSQKIPKFTELLLQCYNDWEDGKIDMNEMKEDLWNYGGIKLMEGERDTTNVQG